MVLLTMPFIHPFRWSRLFWTYLLPVVSLDCAFGWAVSCLRTYTVPESQEMTDALGSKHCGTDPHHVFDRGADETSQLN